MKSRFLAVVLVVSCAVPGLAQSRPDYRLFTDPGRRFSVEFPEEWRWMIVSGSGEPLATFVHPRNEAAVVVERFRLKQRLGPEEITDLFAEIETDYLKANQPQVSDVAARVNTQGTRRTIVIDYVRPGAGEGRERERVRQYSFPVGGDLYRVTCMALFSQFARYEATFLNVAESLKAAGDLRAPPGR